MTWGTVVVSLVLPMIASTILGMGTRIAIRIVWWSTRLLPPEERDLRREEWTEHVQSMSHGPIETPPGNHHLVALGWSLGIPFVALRRCKALSRSTAWLLKPNNDFLPIGGVVVGLLVGLWAGLTAWLWAGLLLGLLVAGARLKLLPGETDFEMPVLGMTTVALWIGLSVGLVFGLVFGLLMVWVVAAALLTLVCGGPRLVARGLLWAFSLVWRVLRTVSGPI